MTAGLLDRYAFGWIEEPWRYSGPGFEIFPVENYDQMVAEVVHGAVISRDWIYPPAVDINPLMHSPTIVFLTPSTHYLQIDANVDHPGLSDFLILVLGFFLGLKLTPAGLGHMQRMARRRGLLVDFTDSGRDLEHAMRRAMLFFSSHRNDHEVLALTEAAFHWFLSSQSYNHAFEVFAWQYTVLDNVHRLTEILVPSYAALGGGHAQRPVNLANQFRSPLPVNFVDPSRSMPNAAALARVRNELVHEARWLGQPLGFSANSDTWELLVQLKYFNSQLLLGLLGIECGFRQRAYSRQTEALDVRV